MTAVGLIEKKTQARVVALFRDTPNRNFQVQLPKPKEQTAIAAVLSDRDAEIAALEARRDKTRALKPGMMQELLTGRIRLI
jgi:type I restriction enzyme S subunit